MIPLHSLSSKVYYIVGLARSGKATLAALKKAGARVFLFDDSLDPGTEDYRAPEEMNWSVIDALILSPGIPHTFPKPHRAAQMARQNNVPILCDIDLLAQACPKATFIGVTGTNGKSTTTALLHHLLPMSSMGGNIGRPVLDLDIDPAKQDELILLELSSYQLERVPHLICNIAVWLNVTPDHLERHGNFQGYVDAKKALFSPFGESQTVLIGLEDQASFDVYEDLKKDPIKKVIPFSISKMLQDGISVVGGVLYDQGQEICSLSGSKTLKGVHNHQNIAAAYGVMKALGKPFVLDEVLSFKGLSHRQEYVGERGLVTFINDSKATNITSTLRALSCCGHDVHLIVGGVAKDTGLAGLEAYKKSLTHVYVFGQAAGQFSQELTEKKLPHSCVETLEEATKAAYQRAMKCSKKATVLLSPACASFDQFKDFEQRGEIFKSLVYPFIKEQKESVSHG